MQGKDSEKEMVLLENEIENCLLRWAHAWLVSRRQAHPFREHVGNERRGLKECSFPVAHEFNCRELTRSSEAEKHGDKEAHYSVSHDS